MKFSTSLLFCIATCLPTLLSSQETRRVKLEDREIKAGELTYQAQAGRLYVPENRQDPGSRTIELAFVRLKSTADKPGAPLVYLAGGPGNAATPLARVPMWQYLLEICDVILLDQRGTGQSKPLLFWSTPAMQPKFLFGDQETAMAHMLEIAGLAAEHYDTEGIDLAGYNTAESVADIDDLRIALGADKVSLIGHSYGTHLGLAAVRQLGEHIERFISIATSGTGHMDKLPGDLDESVRHLSNLVAADERIGAEMPDLFAVMEQVMDKLDDEPMVIEVIDPRGGKKVDVSVGRLGLQLILMMDLADTSDLPIFPRLLHTIDAGDPSILRWFVQRRYAQYTMFPTLVFVNRGASGATAERWQQIAEQAPTSLFGTVRCMFSPEIDEVLGTRDLGDEFRAPVHSDTEVLFVSGTLDANTPPSQTEGIRQGFANSHHLVVVNAGHEDLMGNAAVGRRVLAFLSGKPIDSATIEAPKLRFAPLTGDVSGFRHPSLQAARR